MTLDGGVEGAGSVSRSEPESLCPLPRKRGWGRSGTAASTRSKKSLSGLSRRIGMRRVGLKRGTGGLLRRAYNPSARSSLRPVSRKRQRVNRVRRQNLEEAFGPRETWRCQVRDWTNTIVQPCFGAVNGHGIKTRARGGSITDTNNIILLCNRHNEQAPSLGLTVHSWEKW